MKAMHFFKLSLCIPAVLLVLLGGCGSRLGNTEPLSTKTAYLMDTIVSVSIYEISPSATRDAEAIADDCISKCKEYERLFSRTIDGSDISRINENAPAYVTVSPETIRLLKEALKYCERTGGMLDITIAPVKDLWRFSDLPTAQVPAQEDLVSLLPHVDYRCVEMNENRVRLRDSEAALDLGFIAKGYIADRLGELLIAEGAVSAVVNLGGNVLTVGSKHGEPFRVGIQKPFADSGVPITRVDCTDSSVVTSGIYERFFTQDETLFHHILDPSTGYPAQTDLLSATVLSKDSATGDALSTACLMLGLDKAKALIDSIDHVEAIFVTTENKIVYTY